jgi:hypothetical protein
MIPAPFARLARTARSRPFHATGRKLIPVAFDEPLDDSIAGIQMRFAMKSAVLVAALAGLSASALAQQAPPATVRAVSHHPTPPGDVSRFTVTPVDPARIIHHFYLHDDGGTIDVSVKDAKDETNLHALRMHVSRVANRLAEGNFALPRPTHARSTPAATHGAHVMFQTRAAAEQSPDAHAAEHSASGPLSSSFTPGAATLSRLKSEIRYSYTQTDTGARVEIVTSNPQAAQAVHDFLRFQITEHRTGDLNAIVRRTYQTREP